MLMLLQSLIYIYIGPFSNACTPFCASHNFLQTLSGTCFWRCRRCSNCYCQWRLRWTWRMSSSCWWWRWKMEEPALLTLTAYSLCVEFARYGCCTLAWIYILRFRPFMPEPATISEGALIDTPHCANFPTLILLLLWSGFPRPILLQNIVSSGRYMVFSLK